jgi:hypothetical protein
MLIDSPFVKLREIINITSNVILITCMFVVQNCAAQEITPNVPRNVKNSTKYLFYLHGRIVQEQWPNPVSPEYGLYEYAKIVDTLSRYGYHVISEVRAKGTDMDAYALRVSAQIDTLLSRGVSPEYIIVAGASMGSGIAMRVAVKKSNEKINYVLIAACTEDVVEYYIDNKLMLCGNFLSIYESSDVAGSCGELFVENDCSRGYKEIKLTMNNKHGFIYRPYAEWVHPMVKWMDETN